MIITPPEFHVLKSLRNGRRRIGLTSGCFDLLHFYHLHYLERCRAECDFLVVGVDSDQLLSSSKNKPACVPEHHRLAMVGALKCVDAVFTMRNVDSFVAAAKLSDLVFKNSLVIYGQAVRCGSAKLVVIPDVEEVQSTSALVAKIRNRK